MTPPDPSRLRIVMLGTRGVPAHYGGFETAVEEVGRRLAARGHKVLVYSRNPDPSAPLPPRHLGMRVVELPALKRRSLETLSHTALSVGHLLRRVHPDVAIVFNAANAPFLPALRAARIPVATHVDGLEWRRGKWGPAGRRYYRAAEAAAVRLSDAIIADAQGIADYYAEEFGAPTALIAYGAPLTRAGSERLGEMDLRPGGFHLLVARFEPENHVDVVVEGYVRSDAVLPLVVVGSAPYSDAYTERIASLSRYIIADALNPAMTSATQGFERTLDDSANKRLSIPEGFLACDGVLDLCINVVDGLVVYPKVIEKHLRAELPFMATENIMMDAVKRGGDRQALHERIRQLSMEAGRKVKAEGKDNDLLERIAADKETFGMDLSDLENHMEGIRYVGRAPRQVDVYLSDVIQPLLDANADLLGLTAEIQV